MKHLINSNNSEHYDKYVVDSTPTMGEGRCETTKCALGQKTFGIACESIYEDKTRNTENDNDSTASCCGSDSDRR